MTDRGRVGLAGRIRRAVGRPTASDGLAGLVTGLFSIPEGMAYASIGGFDPVAGLYAGMVPTMVGSALASTVLMVTTLTSAIALSSHSVLASAGLDPTDPANVAALALVVGAVMALAGLLRLGSVMDFVSNAVMTGFTTGIAVQIVAGVVGDVTGYDPESSNTLVKLVEAVAHVGDWDTTAVAIGVATVAVWALVRRWPRTASLATLIALVVVTLVVFVAGVDAETVGDIASVPSALPPVTWPDLSAVPDLLVGGLAVAVVALAQAAGISAAVPNPSRRRASASSDFTAQGAANLVGAAFGALPTGGSLSRTGVAVSAGAKSRWSGIFAGAWLLALVLVAGRAAEVIPMAVIGGLVMVIGGELIAGRVDGIRLVLRTSLLSTAAMVVTFVATTELPLQQAILIGSLLSLLLYCVRAGHAGRIVALTRAEDGWVVTDVPEVCPSGEITVLHYGGVGFFAEVPRLDAEWPDTSETRDAALLVSVLTLPDVPSSAVITAFRRRARELTANGNRIMIVGLSPELADVVRRSGLAGAVGEDNLFLAEPRVFGALDRAVAVAEDWIASRDPATDERRDPPSVPGG